MKLTKSNIYPAAAGALVNFKFEVVVVTHRDNDGKAGWAISTRVRGGALHIWVKLRYTFWWIDNGVIIGLWCVLYTQHISKNAMLSSTLTILEKYQWMQCCHFAMDFCQNTSLVLVMILGRIFFSSRPYVLSYFTHMCHDNAQFSSAGSIVIVSGPRGPWPPRLDLMTQSWTRWSGIQK